MLYRGANPLFTVGQPASPGLQRQAEAGQPEDLIAAVKGAEGARTVVMFERKDSFTISAQPGDMLGFATMFGHSNDASTGRRLAASRCSTRTAGQSWAITPWRPC